MWLLEESFSGLYLRHATSILRSAEVVRVASLAGSPVGLTMLKTLEEGAGYVYYIAVARSHRGRGVGGRLLDDSISRFAEAAALEVYACVRESNAEGNALFESRGFRRTGFGEMAAKYGELRALNMYRGMLAVPGEAVLVKELPTEGGRPAQTARAVESASSGLDHAGHL